MASPTPPKAPGGYVLVPAKVVGNTTGAVVRAFVNRYGTWMCSYGPVPSDTPYYAETTRRRYLGRTT